MRRWLKITLIVMAVIIVICSVALFYLFGMNGLERIVAARVNALMPTGYPFEVTIGELGGNVLDGLVIERLHVKFADSVGGREVLFANRIEAIYSLRNLLDKKINFASMVLDSAQMSLFQDSTGRFGLPPGSPAKTSDSASGIPEFAIDALRIHNLSLTIFKPTDTLRLYDINLMASIVSREQTVALDLKSASMDSDRRHFRLPSLSGQVTYAQNLIAVRDLTIDRDSTHIKLSGAGGIKERRGSVTFNADNFNLTELEPFTGVKLRGMLDLYGTVQFTDTLLSGTLGLGGQFIIADLNNLFLNFQFDIPEKRLVLDTLYGLVLDRCALDGKGWIDFSQKPEIYQVDLGMEHFNLNALIPGTLTSDLNALIQLDGSSFKNDEMKLIVAGDFYDSYFADYPIHQATGTVEITTKMASFPDTFRVNYFENTFDVTGSVEYSDSISLLAHADLPDLEVYQGRLFLKEIAGRASAEVSISGLTKDPDLSGFLSSDSIWIYDVFSDSLEAGANIEKIFSLQQGAVFATSYGGALYNIPYDTLFTFLDVHQNVIDIDTVALASPEFRALAHGYVHHRDIPQQVYVDSVTLLFRDQRLFNRGQIQFAVDDRGIDFQRGAIASNGSMAMALGRYNFDGTLNLALSVNDVPIRDWVSLFRPDFPLDGRASMEGRLRGSMRDPVFDLSGKVDSIAWENLMLGNLDLIASYKDRTLYLDSTVLASDTGIYRAHGNIKVDLDLTADSLQLLDRPFDLTISATDHRFDLVEAFLPSVEYLGGDMFADVHLYGTPNDPHLEGYVQLTNAKLKYYDLVDTVFSSAATFQMKDNQAVVEQVQAYVLDKRAPNGIRVANIEGTLTFKEIDNIVWDINVSLPRSFPVRYELEDIQAVVEGELSVEGESPPEVTGDLTILSGRYRANFAEPDEGSPIMAVLAGDQSWDLNINLEVPANFWIENDDIDAEFAGNLNVIRENGLYRFIGEMEILRGQAPLFDRTWTIQSGSRAIYDNVAEPNPTLDVTACTIIRGIAIDDEPRKDEELCVVVTGTLEEPQLAVSGDAGFSREDLLPLLVTNSATSDAGNAPFTGFEQRLTGLFSTQVSQIGSRQLSRLGVETFEFDPLYSGRFDPLKSRVTLGFYTTPSLYVYGRSSLSGATGRELGFEYRFNKSFLVEGRRDEEDLYHLNLKLHWEFK